VCDVLPIIMQNELLGGTNVSGHLCIKKPTPGMARTIYGDHERFLDTYYRPHPGLSICIYVLDACLFVCLCVVSMSVYLSLTKMSWGHAPDLA